MPDKTASNLPNVPIEVNVTLQPSPTGETPPRAVVYAFTGAGHFISKAPVGEKGRTTLSVPGAGVARQVRILVGPEIPEKQATVSELTRRGAQEQILRVQPEGKVPPISIVVPYPIWPCWIRFCLVEGTLLKSVLSAGIPVNFPVCGADVQIYEVEPSRSSFPGCPLPPSKRCARPSSIHHRRLHQMTTTSTLMSARSPRLLNSPYPEPGACNSERP